MENALTEQLLATKFFIPPHGAKALLRERLLAQLDQGLAPENRLILVSAPAGYGKTVLLSDWLHRIKVSPRAIATAWLSLDESDNDPEVFFSYFISSLQKAMPGVGDLAWNLLHSPQPAPVAVILASLANDLAVANAPLVMALDDYHLIRSQPVHEGLTFLIDHLPPEAHLVVSARTDPPFPLHRYRGRGQLVELRMDDLRFTRPEMASFLHEFAGFDLGEAEAALLESRTEGWITGIQMAALSLRGREDKAQFIHALASSQRYILDYLAEEVLKNQPEEIQQFLLATSILNRLCAPLCEEVMKDEGPEESHAKTLSRQELYTKSPGDLASLREASFFSLPPSSFILDLLDRSNLFLLPLDDERYWYRYHHLFADLLRVRVQQALRDQPERLRGLHRRAAGWLEANGWYSEAIQHYIYAEEFEKAADLVEQHTLRLFSQGALHELLKWIHLLPPELALRRPRLAVQQAWALAFAARFDELDQLLARLEPIVAAGNIPSEEQRLIQGDLIAIRAIQALTSGNIRQALSILRDSAVAIPPENRFARSVIRWVAGYAARMKGNLPEAVKAFDEVLQIGRQINNTWTILTGSVDLGEALRQSGRLREAEQVYRAALDAINQPDASLPGFLGRLEAFLASVLYERDQVDEAQRLVLQAIEHNRGWENPNHTTYAALVWARIATGQHDFENAQRALDLAAQTIARGVVMQHLHSAAEARQVQLWLAQGNLAQAIAWVDVQPELDLNRSLQIDEETRGRAAVVARVKLAHHDQAGAQVLLDALETDARSGGKAAALVETLTLKALAETDPARAFPDLSEALRLGVPAGYRRIYLDEGEPLRALLDGYRTYLKRQKPSEENTRQIEFAETLLPLAPAVSEPSEATAAPLTGREVEILRCMAEGLSNQEIGLRLYISAGTVKAHSAAIYRKLDVANRTEAIARAKDLGLI